MHILAWLLSYESGQFLSTTILVFNKFYEHENVGFVYFESNRIK